MLPSGRHHSERSGLFQDAWPLGSDPPRVTRDKAQAPPGCLAPGRRRRGLGPSRQSRLRSLRRRRALVAGPEQRARLDPVPPIWRFWGRLTDHHLPPPAPQSTLLTFSSVSRAVWQGSSPFDWGECQSPQTGDRSPQSPLAPRAGPVTGPREASLPVSVSSLPSDSKSSPGLLRPVLLAQQLSSQLHWLPVHAAPSGF